MTFTSLFGKYEYIKVPFGLMQAPAYFQELMTGVLKDVSFAITYLDNIIIFSRMAEEHLSRITQAFLELFRYYRKFIKNYAKMAKSLTVLTCQKAKFEWTPIHHTAFLMLKESVTQVPILCYLDPTK